MAKGTNMKGTNMKRLLFLGLMFAMAIPAMAQYGGGQKGSVTATTAGSFTKVTISTVKYFSNGITLSIVNPASNTDTLLVGYTLTTGTTDTTGGLVSILPGYTYSPPPVMWSAFWIKSSNASGGTHYYYSATGGN